MRVLVVGLGSMGKRRVRNLQALGVEYIAGVDPRADRRAEASSRYSVDVYPELGNALLSFKPEALIISTPPDRHMDIAYPAAERNLPCFIEASVVDMERIHKLHEATVTNGPLIVPSCTMRYFPGPRLVKKLIAQGSIGSVRNFNYHTGQYLKDWHPWEAIEEYYVSHREMGGCREIVPFELTWLNDIFGDPVGLACLRDTVGDLGVDIDDIYHLWLRYPGNATASITVEVLSRPIATRELRVTGSLGQIVYSADENAVRLSTLDAPEWVRHELGAGSVEAGYINPEEPYIAEMKDFLNAVSSGTPSAFQNSLLDDYKVLRVLDQLEQHSI